MSTTPDPGRQDPHPTIDCADQLEPLIAEARRARQGERGAAEANADLLAVNEQLEQIATIDALTQLANRRHFDDRLEQEWNRAFAGESPRSSSVMWTSSRATTISTGTSRATTVCVSWPRRLNRHGPPG
jgi:hypothetical protein